MEAAARYTEMLAGVPGRATPPPWRGNEHVWHLYVVRVPNRDEVLAHLQAAGIGAGLHYPHPVHRTAPFVADAPTLPVSERAAREILSLPLYPHITPEQQERVVDVLTDALRRVAA